MSIAYWRLTFIRALYRVWRRLHRRKGYVYILHLRGGLSRSNGRCARHYVGWAYDWVRRVGCHRSGRAKCRFTEVAFERGIWMDVAVVVRGDRTLERKIKRGGHYNRWCPMCGGKLVDYRDELLGKK